MSILIKNMEMPKACVFCELYDWDLHWCRGAKKEVPYSPEDKRAKFCPLVPVPPHGRLIDADALYRTIDATSERTIGHTTLKETVLLDIRGMPTILESTMGQVNSEKAINEAEREE